MQNVKQMSAQDFEVCRKCSGTMKRISTENTSPLITECLHCGHREWAEIHFSPPWLPDKKGMEYARVVIYKEEGKVRKEEIKALRKINPELRNLSMHEAAKRIKSSQSIDLGIHLLVDAQNLFKRAEKWGLNAWLEHPEMQLFNQQDKRRSFELFRVPVSVGKPGKKTALFPFIWIIIFVMLILILILWLFLR